MGREDVRAFWDERAATFDDEPDHGLADPETRRAWATLLDGFLGESDGPIVDLGCGTGSVSALLAERGHRVLGIDLSPRMIEQAERKARLAGLDIEFLVGDVRTATVPTSSHGAIVSRHVLWAVPDPEAVVTRWSAPLVDDGMFIAVEGVWNGAGIAGTDLCALLEQHFGEVEHLDLSDRPVLWGAEVTDHRYAAVGRRPIRRP